MTRAGIIRYFLTMVVLVFTGYVTGYNRGYRRSMEQTDQAIKLALDWKGIAERFETASKLNEQAANECLGIDPTGTVETKSAALGTATISIADRLCTMKVANHEISWHTEEGFCSVDQIKPGLEMTFDKKPNAPRNPQVER